MVTQFSSAGQQSTVNGAKADPLFTPLQIGPYNLTHRVVMAPLTRSRSRQPGNEPWELNATYYRQRASAALIITEATQISQQGQGYAWTPGIHSEGQVVGWRKVTDAVHAEGGLIFQQLWHVGRVSHPSFQPGGALPVAPSALAPEGQAFIEGEDGNGAFAPIVTPRALETEEIPAIVEQHVAAARNALAAGFDGVEVHAANGYLLDQFINSKSNHRQDVYGGSVENRARLLLEVVQAVAEVWGADRVGVRLSPLGSFNDVGDDAPEETFTYIAEQLNRFGLAYLHLVEPRIVNNEVAQDIDPRAEPLMASIRAKFQGPLIVAGGYDGATARAALRAGRADLIAFGRTFLANPDLPARLRLDEALNAPRPEKFYGGGPEGYTDYPTLAELGAQAAATHAA